MEFSLKGSLKNIHKEKTMFEEKHVNIQEVLNVSLKTSIYDVLAYYGIKHNKKLCRCPFHDDKKPSLNIFTNNDEYYSWYCFVCNIGGTVYNFIKLMEDNNIHKVAEVLSKINQIDIQIFYSDFNVNFLLEENKNKAIEEKLKKLKAILVSIEYRKLKEEFNLTDLENNLILSYFKYYDSTNEGLDMIEKILNQIRKEKECKHKKYS